MANYEWQIWTNYGYGWEHETTELSKADANEQMRLYRENAVGCSIKCKRVRINK